MKVCKDCGAEKSLTEFHKRHENKDGLSTRCKPCALEVQWAWRRKNPEKYMDYVGRSEDGRVKDTTYFVKKILSECGRRSAKKGLEFDLTLEGLPPVPDTCPILGTPLVHAQDHDSSPSLDRIVPSRGYVRSNVAWISRRANRIKNDASLEELESVTRWLREQLRAEGIVP